MLSALYKVKEISGLRQVEKLQAAFFRDSN